MRIKFDHTFDYFVLLFFSLAVSGWLWEVALSLVSDHAFVNRGVYEGPYLPIYGAGGLLICLLFRRLRRKPVRVFVLSAFLCSVLEYLTGYFLEKHWGVRWWDYTGHFMNLNGRVCLFGAAGFGIGGALLVCAVLPLYDRIYAKTAKKWRIALSVLLLLLFAADAAYCAMRPNTGRGITAPAS